MTKKPTDPGVMIDLPLFFTNTMSFSRVVEAKIVPIAPHLSWTFAVHRVPLSFLWQVSDVEIGGGIPGHDGSRYWQTRKEAISSVTERFATVTDADVERVFTKITKKCKC